MGSTNWPLTGAVPCQFYDAEDYLVERLYMAGYQDGSVRIWDATYPTLSLIYVLRSDVRNYFNFVISNFGMLFKLAVAWVFLINIILI